ncbi:MAG TPA: DegT/DnrJ/EryC1/StrS family aminotransferase [Trueperaceae bacterium]|nr:DegT/DnrJ/EryC1/StrS family aminotransferase [Trueperaceae bacterium]
MPRDTFLPFSPPSIGAEEIEEVAAALRSDWITTGPRTKEFERAFGAYVGAPGGTSLMLNSCTAGLHVALVALGVGPGDEVIVPTLTFAATANVVEHVGARPVLVDVLPDTLCIDPAAVEAAVTPRTKAVIPVHYAGQAADLDAIFAVAERHGLHVVEDAAHAVPTTYRGRLVGSRENLASFSFYATKNLTTAEGGALTGSPELLEKARVIGLHGMSADGWKRFDKSGSWQYDVVMPGFKYNMTDLQAALGLRQLERLGSFHQRRREVARLYDEAFGQDERFQTPVEADYGESSWHLYVLRLNRLPGLDRDAFVEELKSRNIGFSVHYRPLHMMSYYRDKYGYDPDAFPVAKDAFERMLSLPLHPRLTDEDVEDVIREVRDVATAQQEGASRWLAVP